MQAKEQGHKVVGVRTPLQERTHLGNLQSERLVVDSLRKDKLRTPKPLGEPLLGNLGGLGLPPGTPLPLALLPAPALTERKPLFRKPLSAMTLTPTRSIAPVAPSTAVPCSEPSTCAAPAAGNAANPRAASERKSSGVGLSTAFVAASHARKTGRYERAVELFDAISQGPHRTQAFSMAAWWVERTLCLEKLGRYEDLMAVFIDAAKCHPRPLESLRAAYQGWVFRLSAMPAHNVPTCLPKPMPSFVDLERCTWLAQDRVARRASTTATASALAIDDVEVAPVEQVKEQQVDEVAAVHPGDVPVHMVHDSCADNREELKTATPIAAALRRQLRKSTHEYDQFCLARSLTQAMDDVLQPQPHELAREQPPEEPSSLQGIWASLPDQESSSEGVQLEAAAFTAPVAATVTDIANALTAEPDAAMPMPMPMPMPMSMSMPVQQAEPQQQSAVHPARSTGSSSALKKKREATAEAEGPAEGEEVRAAMGEGSRSVQRKKRHADSEIAAQRLEVGAESSVVLSLQRHTRSRSGVPVEDDALLLSPVRRSARLTKGQTVEDIHHLLHKAKFKFMPNANLP